MRITPLTLNLQALKIMFMYINRLRMHCKGS